MGSILTCFCNKVVDEIIEEVIEENIDTDIRKDEAETTESKNNQQNLRLSSREEKLRQLRA